MKAIIIGWCKMGASIEEVCVYMGIDGMEVQKVFEKTEVLKVKYEAEKIAPTRNKFLHRPQSIFPNGKNKKPNTKNISRSIQTHTGL